MRLLISLIIVLLIFLGIGWKTQQEILNTTSQMRAMIPAINQDINAEDWGAASEKAKDLMKWWNRIQDRWDLFLTHQEIDDIELLIARAKSYISSEDDSEALAELAALDMKLSQVYRNEIFNLQNVL